MGLYRIHKEANTPFDAYTEHETELIKSWYQKGKTNDEVNALLKTCWEEQTWLQCDCQEDYAPIMHIRHLADNFHIVRMLRYGKHADSCPFSSKPYVQKKHQTQTQSAITQKEADLKDQLLELIYQAELNQLPLHAKGYGRPLNVQYEDLKDSVSSVFGDRYEQYSNLFITHPNGLKACRSEIDKFIKTNPEGDVPIGYLLFMADKINGKTAVLTSKGQDYSISCQGDIFIEAIDYSGPWIGLVSIKKLSSGTVEPCDGIFMPAMRKSLLCPLRTDEQVLMNSLIPLQGRAAEKDKRILCTKYLPLDDHYHQGLSFNIRSGKRAVDVAILHTEEGVEDLPKGCLYHLQLIDGSKHSSEHFMLKYIQQRLGLD